MKQTALLLSIILLLFPFIVSAQSIVTTRHNLSVSGPGTIKATSESEICIFCHTPHNSAPKVPLWNRNVSGSVYTLYTSSTMNASPGQPDGSSILCLSCHDGTIALGSVVSRITPIDMTSAMSTRGNLTTDLSNDHPISFTYNSSLATADGQLKTPPLAIAHLDNNSKLQCTSCHNPHSEINPNFLVATNQNSALCNLCHEKAYWTSSSHNTSTKTWNGIGTNPWAHIDSPYSTVAENACANCHDTHNANGKLRLLKYAEEENNCFDCHNGNVASTNIQAQFAVDPSLKHNVDGYTGIHDPAEAISVTNKHVECQDCHNPHASNASTAVAPFVNGFNIGVSGINQAGVDVTSATYTYEICYKCHAGNTWAPASALPRVIVQNNVRLEFATGNPSFHPIVGTTTSTSPSLIDPLERMIYCTDCHASNNTTGPKGPHSSAYPHILKYQYTTTDYTAESPTAYALCYSCHSRTSILANVTFPLHYKHIVDANTPCSVCHDSHGISSTQGTITKNSNLINFRSDVVFEFNGSLRFVDTGDRSGYCLLRCHNKNHGVGMSSY